MFGRRRLRALEGGVLPIAFLSFVSSTPTHHHTTHPSTLPLGKPTYSIIVSQDIQRQTGEHQESVMRSCSGCDSVRPVYFSTKQQCLCAKRWPLSVCPIYFASPSTTSRIIGNATLAPNLGYSSYTPHSPGPIAGPRGRYRDGDDSNDMTRSARHWPSITNAPGVCPPRYPSGFCLSST
ncbi:hypothetical protein CSPX01_04709 [Colletotrichum filicis]|nr:hypothetical protein CSPX01_04709 [Colletotrichum filicis]